MGEQMDLRAILARNRETMLTVAEKAMLLWREGTSMQNCSKARGAVLVKAMEVINGERQDQYGNPEDSFALIAQYWSAHLGKKVTAADVAVMMTLFKLARQKHQHKVDNLVDAAGYIGILGDMEDAA